MKSSIDITVKTLILPLFGVEGIDVLINGQTACETDLGQTFTLKVESCQYQIDVRLRGGLNRTSNAVPVDVSEGQHIRLVAAYNRFWGSFRLRLR